MNWYKCSNGSLVNLDHAAAIAAEPHRPHASKWIVRVHFTPQDSFFDFPDTFTTREAAVQFIAELYEEMAV